VVTEVVVLMQGYVWRYGKDDKHAYAICGEAYGSLGAVCCADERRGPEGSRPMPEGASGFFEGRRIIAYAMYKLMALLAM
jgi:hypothetical protein